MLNKQIPIRLNKHVWIHTLFNTCILSSVYKFVNKMLRCLGLFMT